MEEVSSFNKDLLIVTKNRNQDDLLSLLKIGKRIFGENRVQEAEEKFTLDLRKQFPDIELHLIGPLQSRKTQTALNIFDVIQTIDRKKIIDEIVKVKAKSTYIKTREFYIQVNIGSEIQKFGVDKNELSNLYDYSLDQGLNITGLMCIPPNIDDPSIFFREMLVIKNKINKNLKLSMGMSSDYLYALNEGSDIVRIGSSIFL